MNIKNIFERYLENFFGILIALNILHQIMASTTLMENYPEWLSLFELFYQVSIIIFVIEIAIRTYLDKRLGFLGGIDLIVVLNYFILGFDHALHDRFLPFHGLTAHTTQPGHAVAMMRPKILRAHPQLG